MDQKWMEAIRAGKTDYQKQNYTEKWFEILGWLPTVVLTKPMAMERVAHLNFKPGEGIFVDQFKLMAVYGDVALATDRRIRKVADAKRDDCEHAASRASGVREGKRAVENCGGRGCADDCHGVELLVAQTSVCGVPSANRG